MLSRKLPDRTERPIEFASRTLSTFDKKYALQLETVGLACVFGVKEFHHYLLGRSFTLYEDHKQLVSLFNMKRAILAQVSAGILRWALNLAAYHYVLAFKHECRC